MNILQLQDNLKNFSEDQLVREMQMPSGQVPQFLVLSELGRRKRVKEDFTRQQAANQPTVAQETVAAAGVPQSGATDMARAMAPKTSTTENTGIGSLMPKQPTRMADGGVVKMATAGQPEALKARPGAMTGGVVTAIAQLKTQFPDAYEQVKDDPEKLIDLAISLAKSAKTPETTGLEGMETDMSEQAKPFVMPFDQFEKDTSGDARMVGPNAKMFNLPIGQFLDIPNTLQNLTQYGSYEDYEMKYPPIKPGEYYYKGNAFLLGPDGTMIERKSNVPVSDETKSKIIEANIGKVPIENYGEAPTDNTADLESLISDQQEGMPVESVRGSSGLDPKAIFDAQIVPTPSVISTPSLLAAGLPSSEDVGISKPTRISQIGVPSGSDEGLFMPEPSDSAVFEGMGGETNFGYGPGSIAETEAIRKFLASEGSIGLADAYTDQTGLAKKGDLDTLAKAYDDIFIDTGDPIRNLVNQRVVDYLSSDQYTPKEEIYDLGPKGRIKYENEDPAERDRLFTEASQREFLERQADAKAAETRASEFDDAFMSQNAAADRIGRKMTSDNAARQYSTQEKLVDYLTDKATDVAGYVGDKVRENAAIRRANEVDETAVGRMGEIVPINETEIGKKNQLAKDKEQLEKIVNGDKDAGGSGGGAGGKGAGAAGGLEGQLAQMLKDMEKSREQDKWLAIAQIGAEMMKPTATFGEGIGNAISKGADAMREGKKQYSQDKLSIMALQQRIDAAKLAASSKGSSGLTTNQSMTRGLAMLKQGEDMLANANISGNVADAERARQIIDYSYALMGIPSFNTNSGAVKAPSAS